jgi:hypothetical protein
MAWYVDGNFLVKANGTEALWTTDYDPGASVPQSGIYKCRSCNREVTCNHGDPFPPPSHHAHAPNAVKWRMLVWTNTKGS